ncbi:MAG TPA: putative maltokinase, partial [Stellaceae bacterium]|nr:putative maltokinase [Stellaceae bacterium]
FLQSIEVRPSGGEKQHYFLPLAAVWLPAGSEARQQLMPQTLAELRQFRREGVLVDALSRDGFLLALFNAVQREDTVAFGDDVATPGEIRFRHTPLFEEAPLPERIVARRLGAEQSNSSILIEEYAVLKMYRRLQAGPHPEIEMGRFLVERAGFTNTPPLLATIELVEPGETESSALGVMFGFERNQGDGWNLALDYLLRYLDDSLNEAAPGALPPGRTAELPDPDHFFVALSRQLGLRTAQMHRALAEHGAGDPDFAPEPLGPDDFAEWQRDFEQSVTGMLARLKRVRAAMPDDVRELADAVVAAEDRLFGFVRSLAARGVNAVKTRYHGDFHLGQVLAVQNDFYIIDFEGEPARPLAARRRKSSPLRDVAGMIRSFDYAATSAVRQMAETRPSAVPRMAELADAWRQRAVDGFRAAYHKTMRGCPAYPAKAQAKMLIDYFTLEKAVYEVNYELANRPGWVAIPLNGMLRVLAKLTGNGNAAAS